MEATEEETEVASQEEKEEETKEKKQQPRWMEPMRLVSSNWFRHGR